MLFITNRAPTGSMSADPGSPYKFDLDNNAAGKHVFYCRRNGAEDYTEV